MMEFLTFIVRQGAISAALMAIVAWLIWGDSTEQHRFFLNAVRQDQEHTIQIIAQNSVAIERINEGQRQLAEAIKELSQEVRGRPFRKTDEREQ